MLMRRKLLMIVLVLGCLSLHADEYEYLWLHSPSASATRSFALSDLRKITFGDDAMSVWLESQSSPVSWSYANLLKMTFEQEPTTGVEDVTVDTASGIIIRCTSDAVRVESAAPLHSVCLYNTQGMLQARFGQGQTAVAYPLHALPSGIYIVAASDGHHTATRKFVKR